MAIQLSAVSSRLVSAHDHASPRTLDTLQVETLYNQLAPSLLAYLRASTGRRHIAEDLLQETFCRFLLRQPAAMPPEEARRYLFRIATNLLRDRWRRHEDQPFSEPSDPVTTPSPELQLDMHRTLQTLKPRERELLWLAYVEGMSHTEIAVVTGLSALSIRLLLFRARKQAANLLEPAKDTQ